LISLSEYAEIKHITYDAAQKLCKRGLVNNVVKIKNRIFIDISIKKCIIYASPIKYNKSIMSQLIELEKYAADNNYKIIKTIYNNEKILTENEKLTSIFKPETLKLWDILLIINEKVITQNKLYFNAIQILLENLNKKIEII
jgi:hypothetical protein